MTPRQQALANYFSIVEKESSVRGGRGIECVTAAARCLEEDLKVVGWGALSTVLGRVERMSNAAVNAAIEGAGSWLAKQLGVKPR